MHLGTYFAAQSQALFSDFFSILEHSNFTDCFGGEGFALDFNNCLQAFFKPSLFLSY